MLNHELTSKQGNVGLGLAISWFCIQGWGVSIPLNDIHPYDLIVDDGQLRKVQVRTTRHKRGGSFKVNLRNSHQNRIVPFNQEKVDFLFIVTETAKYYIPAEVIGKRKYQLALNRKMDKFKIEQV